MASIKQLKKDLNNDIGYLIEEVYLWELSNPNGDLSKSEKLIEEAIQAFDNLISKINSVSGDHLKKKFKEIETEKSEVVTDLLKKSANL
jgi:hypothetical protein